MNVRHPMGVEMQLNLRIIDLFETVFQIWGFVSAIFMCFYIACYEIILWLIISYCPI